MLAIIITIMVLELRLPKSNDWHALGEIAPELTAYALSYVYIGIYWVNHHHLLQAASKVTAGILWSNLNLLFWLSLVPFATRWMGASGFSTAAVAIYAVLLLLPGAAFTILQGAIVRSHHYSGEIMQAMQKVSRKAILSTALYASAFGLAFVHPYLSCGIFVLVSVIWLIPERNLERALSRQGQENKGG